MVAWAYAVGSLLALLQDRAFRQALALQHFRRKVSRLREPFLLLVGYGPTGELLGRWLDGLGRRFVVIDENEDRIDGSELGSYYADVPALVADARVPAHLGIAGLTHPSCEAVLALTETEETNLAVVMAAALLRPQLPVIAHATSAAVAERMRAFGRPTVVSPFDCLDEHLGLALKAPASYQLLRWLESGPGAELLPRGKPPQKGAWVVCGYGRLGRELTANLRTQGTRVTPIGQRPNEVEDADLVIGDGLDPGGLGNADIIGAVGIVAATDSDTVNLSVVAAARRANPGIFVAARQNSVATGPLFAAMDIDTLLVPTDVIAHEAYAQLVTPLLWQFLREMPHKGDAWAAALIDRMTSQCDGSQLGPMWKVRLTPKEAPALRDWLTCGRLRLGDLLGCATDREKQLPAVAMVVQRGQEYVLAPEDDFVLVDGDEVLFVGLPTARRGLDTTLLVDAVREYVLTGRRMPESWIWRRLTRVSG